MGIPCFYKEIVKNNGDIMIPVTLDKPPVKALYIDANSVIYDSARIFDNNATDKQIIDELILRLEKLIKQVEPSELTFIAFDGVVPMAKMEQQKSRRYKSLLVPNAGNEWDTLKITPGTAFMDKVGYEVKTAFTGKPVIVSDVDCYGEGEQKIFSHLRTYHSNGNIAVYGLDADLILLSVLHSNLVNRMYLIRDTPSFISKLNPRLDPGTEYYMDVTRFVTKLATELDVKNVLDKGTVINDFVFICSLLGNDFVPHNPSLSLRGGGMDLLLESYRNVISGGMSITNDSVINYAQLAKLFTILAQSEHQRLIILERKRNDYAVRIGRQKFDPNNVPLLDRTIEETIAFQDRGWRVRYYWYGLGMDDDEYGRSLACKRYTDGLTWVYHYYRGNTIDTSYSYGHYLPPLFSDLGEYKPGDMSFSGTISKAIINKHDQLRFVLPASLIEKYTQQLGKPQPVNSHSPATINWLYCRYLWESEVNSR